MRTLVLRTGSLGDTVCAVPAFRALRRQFPGDELILLHDAPAQGRISAAEVIRGLGVFDRISEYRGGSGFRSWIDLAVRVRELQPDRVIGLPQRMEKARSLDWKRTFFRLMGVREVYGFVGAERACGRGVTEARRLLALLEREGFCAEHLGYRFPGCSVAQRRVLEWLEPRRQGREVAVLCGGGKTAAQRWGWDRYRELMADLEQRFGVFVVGVGTPREREEARSEMLGRVRGMEWIPEEWGVPELVEMMRESKLYVGNDTGPMHVAAAVGCPVFVVMSARNPVGAWDPDVALRCVVRLRVECEGCFLADCPLPGQPCLGGIHVEHAVHALVGFVEENRLLGNGWLPGREGEERESGRS